MLTVSIMINKQIEPYLLKLKKPGRYVGGEINSVYKNKEDVDVRFAFCFPDTYEIGMSHLGMKILYSQFNEVPYIWCERVFAPWLDAEKIMQEKNIPLWGLESGEPITDFEFIGFTLQYELSYTNILQMLKLANIPLRSCDRKGLKQIVVAGGPCACNPEPLADFFDLFFIGEGEEVDLEVIELFRQCRAEGKSREEFLYLCSQIDGVYVPSLYDVGYNEDGTIASFTPKEGVPAVIHKRIIMDLDNVFYPDKFVVPLIEIVHDRVVEEIFRGCIRGCRFCQAGFLNRPVREKSPETIDRQSHLLCRSTGYDEISLSSLSSSDYTKIRELLTMMTEWSERESVSLSLPSMRVDGFDNEILSKLKSVIDVCARSGYSANEGRHKQKRDRRRAYEHLHGGLQRRLDGGQAVLYDRTSHRNGRGRSWHRYACTEGGRRILQKREPSEGKAGKGDDKHIVVYTEAVYSVPVGTAGQS